MAENKFILFQKNSKNEIRKECANRVRRNERVKEIHIHTQKTNERIPEIFFFSTFKRCII